MKNTEQQEVSKTISLLRFPMAVLVILLHSEVVDDANNCGVDDFLITFFSRGVCNVAVPMFALISGYLFFSGLQEFKWQKWMEKMRKRVGTVLLPYILWNLIVVMWNILYTYILHVTHGTEFSFGAIWSDVGGAGFLWDGDGGLPVDTPLWYVRDLMIIFLFTPIIYLFLRKLRIAGILFILSIYLFGCFPSGIIPQFRLVCLFALGAWYQIYMKPLFFGLSRYRVLLYISSLLCLAIIIATHNLYPKVYDDAQRVFALVGVISVFLVAKTVLKRWRSPMLTVVSQLGSCSFFIYAVHRVTIIYAVNNIVHRLLPLDRDYVVAVAYFVIALVTTVVCYSLYVLLKRLCPNMLSLLVGGR